MSKIAKLYNTNTEDPWRSIEVGIRPFVRSFNEVPGLESISSCSGHIGSTDEVYNGCVIEGPSRRHLTTQGQTLDRYPRLEFEGNPQTAVDYVNFLTWKLDEHGYRFGESDIFQFTLDKGVWKISGPTPGDKIQMGISRVGYWELMADWEILRQFTEEYKKRVEKHTDGYYEDCILEFSKSDLNGEKICVAIKNLQENSQRANYWAGIDGFTVNKGDGKEIVSHVDIDLAFFGTAENYDKFTEKFVAVRPIVQSSAGGTFVQMVSSGVATETFNSFKTSSSGYEIIKVSEVDVLKSGPDNKNKFTFVKDDIIYTLDNIDSQFEDDAVKIIEILLD